MDKANEARAFYGGNAEEDKALFVENLGWLLSQTRAGVLNTEYIVEDETEFVLVEYDGYVEKIDITYYSYMAIIVAVSTAIC